MDTAQKLMLLDFINKVEKSGTIFYDALSDVCDLASRALNDIEENNELSTEEISGHDKNIDIISGLLRFLRTG